MHATEYGFTKLALVIIMVTGVHFVEVSWGGVSWKAAAPEHEGKQSHWDVCSR
jgi:hypothetical protein